jgi:hypothetical protein
VLWCVAVCCGVLRCVVVWCGVLRCVVVWCGMVWCGVWWCGGVVVWYGVVVWVQNLDRDELENKPNEQTNNQTQKNTKRPNKQTQTNKQTCTRTNKRTNKRPNKQNIFFDSELRICKQANKMVRHLVVLYFKALHRANTTALSHLYTTWSPGGFPTGTNGLPYALLGSGTQKGDHFQS